MKRPAAQETSGVKRAKPQAGGDALPLPPHPAQTQKPGAAVSKKHRELWYASDCSGLDAAAMALKKVANNFKHWFASEIDEKCRAVLRASHPDCENIFVDATQHSLKELKKVRDAKPDAALVYTSGFPCQPFSKEGSQCGGEDKRGQVIYSELLLVESLVPDLVVWENVPDLLTNSKFRPLFHDIVGLLTKIKKGGYYVDWKVLDSYTHGQVPASRKRLYIVAVRRDRLQKPWSWPKATSAVGLDSVLAKRDLPKENLDTLSTTHLLNLSQGMTTLRNNGVKNIARQPYVFDLAPGQNFGGVRISYDKFPTITKSHASSLWLVHKGRYATPCEVLRAQGICKTDVRCPQEVSGKKLSEMAGNSFTLTVFKRLFKALLPSIGVHTC